MTRDIPQEHSPRPGSTGQLGSKPLVWGAISRSKILWCGVSVRLLFRLVRRSAGVLNSDFHGAQISETQDPKALPSFRRSGVARRLLDEFEDSIARCSALAVIGGGPGPRHNSARRLYFRRDYVPDGCGATTHDRYVTDGEAVLFEDGWAD